MNEGRDKRETLETSYGTFATGEGLSVDSRDVREECDEQILDVDRALSDEASTIPER
jgi:hypothetical protein